MAFDEGPFVQVACFCETVIRDVSGVVSLIRIIDTVEQSQAGPNPPVNMPSFIVRLKMVIMLKSGMALGRHDLQIIPQLPTKETREPLLYSVHLEGEEKGQNFVVDFAFPIEQEGTYWFNVYFDDEKLTAIPLRAKYSRQITTPRSPQ